MGTPYVYSYSISEGFTAVVFTFEDGSTLSPPEIPISMGGAIFSGSPLRSVGYTLATGYIFHDLVNTECSGSTIAVGDKTQNPIPITGEGAFDLDLTAGLTYEHITYNGNKIQVDSAIRDGDGRKISKNYVHYMTISDDNKTIYGKDATGNILTYVNVPVSDVKIGDSSLVSSRVATIAVEGTYNASTNPLTTKEFVNSSIETSTATFRGTFNSVSDLELTSSTFQDNSSIATALGTKIATADKNDYSFVQVPDAFSTPTVIKEVRKFKHNGTAWVYEYTLNNSGFTSAQWNAINSGINATTVGKLVLTDSTQEISGTKTFTGAITATGGITGNVTGNCSGSSGSCTGNAATATTATNYNTSSGTIKTALDGKQDTLSSTQINACNSGITSEKVTKLDNITVTSVYL